MADADSLIRLPMFSPAEDDRIALAWMGGFFDGEGCISVPLSTSPWPKVVHLDLSQNDPSPLHLFRERFGGSVNLIWSRGRGYKWALGRISGVHRTLIELLPYLRVKRLQATLALEYIDLPITAVRRASIADELRRLKDIRPRSSYQRVTRMDLARCE